MYFPDVPPNGEETAANGAPPHFRIERNFLGYILLLRFFNFRYFHWTRGQLLPRCSKQSPPRCRRNENLCRSP